MLHRFVTPLHRLLLGCSLTAYAGASVAQERAVDLPRSVPTLAEPESDPGSGSLSLVPPEVTDRSAPVAASAAEPSGDQELHSKLRSEIRSSHPWARFPVGAWRRAQTVSEAFDAAGEFAGRSLTERTDRLVALDDSSYTIATETVISLAGLRRPEPTETRRLQLLTDRPHELGEPTVIRGEATSVVLDGVALPCRQWTVRSADEDRGEEDLLYLAEGALPRLLRKERQAVAEGEASTRSVSSVTRLATPSLLAQSITPAWHQTTTVTQPDGSRSEAFSIHSLDVPGGMQSEAITEYDASGRRLRWAVTTIVVAGSGPGQSANVGGGNPEPAVSVEVRPRRFLRMLRRDQRRSPDTERDL